MQITPEKVGYWFLRLNGFLSIENFVVHPDEAGNQRTDIDVIGVRFPYRAELLRESMTDYHLFTQIDHVPFIVFTEIKKGRCSINRSLLNNNLQNIERLLRAVGLFPPDQVEDISNEIYSSGFSVSENYKISLVSIGAEFDDNLSARYEHIPQITWIEVTSFIFERFRLYRSRKENHDQWDDVGKFLFKATSQFQDVAEFHNFIVKLWEINN